MRLSLSTDEEEDSKDANAPKESVYLNTFSRVGGDNEECGTENESEGESRPQQPQASDPSYDKGEVGFVGRLCRFSRNMFCEALLVHILYLQQGSDNESKNPT